jgi:hypothetical protein
MKSEKVPARFLLRDIATSRTFENSEEENDNDERCGGGKRVKGDFFHQKIIKVFYGDDGFGEPAVRSVNVRA